MLSRWLTFTAFLAGSANPQRAAAGQGALTVAPTCRVKGHPGAELTLNCGDRKNTGVVQYWHTPFGDLQTPGFLSKLDPVFMHHDGALVVPNSSAVHSGLYYCLLQHTGGTTLWPYELHIGFNNQKNQEHSKYEQDSSHDAFRFRRDLLGPEEERQHADVSDGQFAGAVAASVLLTFVLGFSAGALTRTHVLRCLGAVTARVRSPWQRRRQTDTPDRGSEVTMTTLPPMCDNKAFEMGQVWADVTMETTISSTTSSPPAKPQRSFRHKREEPQENTVYLEGCDSRTEEEQRMEEEEKEEEGGRSLEEKSIECEGEEEEEREFCGFYLLEESGGRQTEADEDQFSEDGEEKKGGGDKEIRGKERDEKEEEEEGWKEETDGGGGEKKREEDICRDSQQSSTETEEEETDGKKQDTVKNGIMGGGGGGAAPRPARRSRVIRLYQYDEDGQRYCHLPDPSPDEPTPPPRMRQRSVSLTRLNAIMAAASAGPLDRRETGGADRGETSHFHMEI